MTEDQIMQLAQAICPFVSLPRTGLPDPLRIIIGVMSLPESIIDEAEDTMGAFTFAGHPAGPFGKHIIESYLEVKSTPTGCAYQIVLVGRVMQGATPTEREAKTAWKPI